MTNPTWWSTTSLFCGNTPRSADWNGFEMTYWFIQLGYSINKHLLMLFNNRLIPKIALVIRKLNNSASPVFFSLSNQWDGKTVNSAASHFNLRPCPTPDHFTLKLGLQPTWAVKAVWSARVPDSKGETTSVLCDSQHAITGQNYWGSRSPYHSPSLTSWGPAVWTAGQITIPRHRADHYLYNNTYRYARRGKGPC